MLNTHQKMPLLKWRTSNENSALQPRQRRDTQFLASSLDVPSYLLQAPPPLGLEVFLIDGKKLDLMLLLQSLE
jgi:hypothetical protein